VVAHKLKRDQLLVVQAEVEAEHLQELAGDDRISKGKVLGRAGDPGTKVIGGGFVAFVAGCPGQFLFVSVSRVV